MGVAAHPLTFNEALAVWEICKGQLEDSRQDYLDAKNFGNAATQFTCAVILAESFCLTEEARLKYEQIADDEYHAVLLAEKDAVDAEELMAAIREEAESA